MKEPKAAGHARDDARDQPESGYPEGHVPTGPSAEPEPEAARLDTRKGSESEFDSAKERPE